MNSNELLQPLHEALTLAQELVSLAQAEEWEAMELAVTHYEQQLSLLGDSAYMQAINDAHLADEAKEVIVKIQTINDDLDSYTLLKREKTASELRQLSQSGKALEAYGR
jgi:hypothetical protein